MNVNETLYGGGAPNCWTFLNLSPIRYMTCTRKFYINCESRRHQRECFSTGISSKTLYRIRISQSFPRNIQCGVILFLCCRNIRTKLYKGGRNSPFEQSISTAMYLNREGECLRESYHAHDKRISEGRHYSAVIEWYFFRTVPETDDTIWFSHKKLWYHICGIKILRSNNQSSWLLSLFTVKPPSST